MRIPERDVDPLEAEMKTLQREKSVISAKNERLLSCQLQSSNTHTKIFDDLPENQQVVFDRCLKNLHFRLLDEVTETHCDENGFRLRDWLLSETSSERSISLVGEKSGTPVIAVENIVGVPACPLQRSFESKLFTSRYKEPQQVVRDPLADSVGEDNPPLVHKEESRIMRKLEKFLWSEYQTKKRRYFTDHKKRVRTRFLSLVGYDSIGRTASIPAEQDPEKSNE